MKSCCLRSNVSRTRQQWSSMFLSACSAIEFWEAYSHSSILRSPCMGKLKTSSVSKLRRAFFGKLV